MPFEFLESIVETNSFVQKLSLTQILVNVETTKSQLGQFD